MSEHHTPRPPCSEDHLGSDDQNSADPSGVSGAFGRTASGPRVRKAITPDDDDFDAPPPRTAPAAAVLPDLVAYDGTIEAELKMLCDLGCDAYRLAKRNFAAAENVDPDSQAHERASSRGNRLASTCRQLFAAKAAIVKMSS